LIGAAIAIISGGEDALVFPDCRCSFVGHNGSCGLDSLWQMLMSGLRSDPANQAVVAQRPDASVLAEKRQAMVQQK